MNVRKKHTPVIRIVETLLDHTFVLAILAMNWTLLGVLAWTLMNAMQTYMAVLTSATMLLVSTTVVVIVDMPLVWMGEVVMVRLYIHDSEAHDCTYLAMNIAL